MADFEQSFISGQGEKKMQKRADAKKDTRQMLVEIGYENIIGEIVYKRDDGIVERRLIEPFEFKVTGRSEKIYAHCRKHMKTESFHLLSIISIKKRPDLTRVSPYPYVGPKPEIGYVPPEEFATPEDMKGLGGSE